MANDGNSIALRIVKQLSRWVLPMAFAWSSTAWGQPSPETLRIQDYPGVIGTLSRVIIEKGYCAKYGIRCTVQTIPTAPLGIQTLLAGGIDVALSAVEVAIQSAAKGTDLKIVGGMFDVNPFMLVVGSKLPGADGKGFPAIMQVLKGKKIGVTARGAGPEFQFKSMLIDVGLQPDDVTFVAVGSPNTAYPALIHGQVDAVMTFTPIDGLCDVMKTCRIAMLPAKGEGPAILTRLNGAGGVYVMRGADTVARAKTVDAFKNAIRDAERFATDPANASELLQITFKYYRLDMPRGDEVLENSLARFRGNFVARVNAQSVQATADYLLQNGQLDKRFDTAPMF